LKCRFHRQLRGMLVIESLPLRQSFQVPSADRESENYLYLWPDAPEHPGPAPARSRTGTERLPGQPHTGEKSLGKVTACVRQPCRCPKVHGELWTSVTILRPHDRATLLW